MLKLGERYEFVESERLRRGNGATFVRLVKSKWKNKKASVNCSNEQAFETDVCSGKK